MADSAVFHERRRALLAVYGASAPLSLLPEERAPVLAILRLALGAPDEEEHDPYDGSRDELARGKRWTRTGWTYCTGGTQVRWDGVYRSAPQGLTAWKAVAAFLRLTPEATP